MNGTSHAMYEPADIVTLGTIIYSVLLLNYFYEEILEIVIFVSTRVFPYVCCLPRTRCSCVDDFCPVFSKDMSQTAQL